MDPEISWQGLPGFDMFNKRIHETRVHFFFYRFQVSTRKRLFEVPARNIWLEKGVG